jgi:hypothetical protein
VANLGVKMAKQIIKIDVKAAKADVTKLKVDCLALGVYSDQKNSELLNTLDKKLGGAIANVQKIGDFKPKRTAVSLFTRRAKSRQAEFCSLAWAKRKTRRWILSAGHRPKPLTMLSA